MIATGSILNPFSDLTSVFAGAAVTPGHTIFLRGGVYTQVLPALAISGAADAPITIRAYPGEPVTLLPSAGYRGLDITNLHYLTIEDIELDCTNLEHDGIKITSGASNVTLRRCVVKNMLGPGGEGVTAQGILVTDGDTNNITIDDCEVYNCGRSNDYDHAIYLAAGDNLAVTNCYLHDNPSHGIHAYSGANGAALVFNGNTVENCRRGIGVYFGQASIIGNTVIDCLLGISCRYSIESAIINDNTFSMPSVEGANCIEIAALTNLVPFIGEARDNSFAHAARGMTIALPAVPDEDTLITVSGSVFDTVTQEYYLENTEGFLIME